MRSVQQLFRVPTLAAAVTAGVLVAGAAFASGGADDPSPANSGVTSTSTVSTERGTTQPTTITTEPTTITTAPDSVDGVDISGPCDEAEHADDPRCAGVVVTGSTGSAGSTGSTTSTTFDRPTTSTTMGDREDISGPCDEAEHADDPRCAGTGTADSGRSGRDSDDDSDDDRSGSSGSSDDDSSGRGRGRGSDD